MKKRIAAALLLLGILLLTACGESPAPAVTPTPAPDAVPEATPTPAPKPIERPALSEPSGVFTDWSKLTEYVAPREKYTRLSPEPLTELRPDDYGLLLPFVGERKYEVDYSWAAGSRYGLVTADGCIVLDAVCDSIRRGENWADGNVIYQNYYILECVEYDPNDPKANEYNEGFFSTYAVCALDGSWFTGFIYDGVYAMPDGVACVIDGEKNLVECFDTEGNFLFSTVNWPIRDLMVEWSAYSIGQISDDGWVNISLRGDDVGEWEYGYVNAEGELLETEYGSRFERAKAFSEGLAAVLVDDKWGYIDETGDWVIEPEYPIDWEPAAFKNGRALISGDGRSLLIDKSGREVASTEEALWYVDYGAYPVYCSHDNGAYYDENLQPILIEGKRATGFCEAGVYVRDGDGITLRRRDGALLHFPDTDEAQYHHGYYVAGVPDKSFGIYDSEGELLFKTGPAYWAQVAKDLATGECYVFADKNGYTAYNMAGEKLVSDCRSSQVISGLFYCEDSTTVGYKNTQNEWVFRLRLDSGD